MILHLWNLKFIIILIPITIIALFLIRIMLFKTGLIHVTKKLHGMLQDILHVHQFLKVPELNESMQPNPLYRKVFLYLHSLPSIEDSDFTNLVTGTNQNDIVLCLDANQIIEDQFLGATILWFNQKTEPDRTGNRTGSFLLKIRRNDKRRILRAYLRHIHDVAADLESDGKRELRLFFNGSAAVNGGGMRWRSVPFTHPSTFDTIAMGADLKSKVKSDLQSFLRGRKYYRRLGRAWRRSFLLYGPSGTGKSSFVAAMANFLNYDVYDVDLSKICSDSDLKLLLLETTPKSIVVVEDLDKFTAENSPESKSPPCSPSGILNFMDGILSACCGEERVMVFTMSKKDRVDPNLLRPGRVDVHIHFPVCDFSSFKDLASCYLGVSEHKLFPRVEEIFARGASLTPAEIGELMIANRGSPSRAIKSVILALRSDGEWRGCREGIERRRLDYGDDVDEDDVLSGEGLHKVKDLPKLCGLFRLKNRRRSHSSNSLVQIIDYEKFKL